MSAVDDDALLLPPSSRARRPTTRGGRPPPRRGRAGRRRARRSPPRWRRIPPRPRRGSAATGGLRALADGRDRGDAELEPRARRDGHARRQHVALARVVDLHEERALAAAAAPHAVAVDRRRADRDRRRPVDRDVPRAHRRHLRPAGRPRQLHAQILVGRPAVDEHRAGAKAGGCSRSTAGTGRPTGAIAPRDGRQEELRRRQRREVATARPLSRASPKLWGGCSTEAAVDSLREVDLQPPNASGPKYPRVQCFTITPHPFRASSRPTPPLPTLSPASASWSA